MSQLSDTKNRQIIPRWYPFNTACRMGDLIPDNTLQKSNVISSSFFKKADDWEKTQKLSDAIDLVGTALVIGDLDNLTVHDAARFIIGCTGRVSPLGIEMAKVYNSDQERSALSFQPTKKAISERHRQIAQLKSVVRLYPRNAIAWSDLAYYYTILGQKQQAEYCMDIAVSIARENRFVLRSATRCYLHLNLPDKALYHIHRSNLKYYDPWIVSSEIAVSDVTNHNPRLVKLARRLVKDRNYSDWSLNELAGSLSTLEGMSGSERKAKALLHQALREPNENTLAQMEWLGRSLREEVTRPQKEIIARFEADAWLRYREGKYNESLETAKQWLHYQPFSSRPAIFASYIASVCLGDYNEAIEILQEARHSSPDSLLLRNNLSFALASLNRTDEAIRITSELEYASMDEGFSYTLSATKGLIHFRKGDVKLARELYKKSINGFKKQKTYKSAALAALFHAREEAILQSRKQQECLDEATKLAGRVKDKEIKKLLQSLIDKRKP